MQNDQVEICEIRINNYSFDEVVDAVIKQAQRMNALPRYIVTPNVRHIVLLQDDTSFRQVYKTAWLAVPDGVPLLWVSRLLGTPLKERVNGTDLLESVCERCAQEGLRVYFLGGRPGAAEKAAEVLKDRNPGLEVAGINSPPFGFENDGATLKDINERIIKTHPHILFVGLGAPKQEKWIYENYHKIGVPVSIGIGVSFEFVAGMVKRAPPWMQRIGLEWFYRLVTEPKRLWKRYAVENVRFIGLILKQLMGK